MTSSSSPAPRPQWRRILSYAGRYKARLTLAVFAKMVASGIFLALPAMVQYVVDTALATDDLSRLNEMTALLIAAFAVLTCGSVLGNYYTNTTGERIVSDLRVQLYTHLQNLSLRFFTERRVGELISRMTSDVSSIRGLLTTDLTRVLRHVLTISGAAVVMLLLNWRLTAFILLTTPFVVLIGVGLRRFSRQGGLQVQDGYAAATVIAEEGFQNIREVKSFVREPYQVARYTAAIQRTLRAAFRLVRARSFLAPAVDFLFLVNIALIVWYGGHEVVAGRLTRGELVGFLVYVAIVGQMVSELGVVYSQFNETLGATQRIFQILDTPSDVQDAPGAAELARVEGRITFEHVSFHYEDRQPVLQDLSLDIAPGEIVALVGPSGAGKSTVFHLIPRFYDVTDGSVCIDGHDVRDVTQASLRAQVGIVPQETLLFGGTIRENILFGRLDATEAEIIEAAQAANAHDFIMALPDGYATMVGERGARLSGGQRQRVAIARALLKDPRILLLDEATSSLDNESEHLVQEALERLMVGRTTVIIAHRLSTVRVAHRLAVLQAGRIVELGTHDELLALNGLYARLYEMQFREQTLLASNGGG
ncbi:MAG: ABC transporter ATP-binding protein [Chloroflexi bacterium]|nr:ABC transporter ATP-binding protein [Chloroflexota bacterium]